MFAVHLKKISWNNFLDNASGFVWRRFLSLYIDVKNVGDNPILFLHLEVNINLINITVTPDFLCMELQWHEHPQPVKGSQIQHWGCEFVHIFSWMWMLCWSVVTLKGYGCLHDQFSLLPKRYWKEHSTWLGHFSVHAVVFMKQRLWVLIFRFLGYNILISGIFCFLYLHMHVHPFS